MSFGRGLQSRAGVHLLSSGAQGGSGRRRRSRSARPGSLAARGRQVLADVVGPDRQLAVTAIDKHGELHTGGRHARRASRSRPGSCGPCRGRRRRGPPSSRAARSRAPSRGRPAARGLGTCVVAVERDVDGAELDLLPAPLLDQRREPLGERDAAGVDADERQPAEVVVALDDLVRDPGEGALEALGVEQVLTAARSGTCVLILSFPSFPASLDRVKGSTRGSARRTSGRASCRTSAALELSGVASSSARARARSYVLRGLDRRPPARGSSASRRRRPV